MKKNLLLIFILFLMFSCSEEAYINPTEYDSDVEIIIEDLLNDKKDFLSEIILKEVESIKNKSESESELYLNEYGLLEENYLEELSSLNLKFSSVTSSKLNKFVLNKEDSSQIRELSKIVYKKTNQSLLEVFAWELIFDLILSFLIELILVGVFAVILISVLFSGNIQENSQYIPETEGGCFSIPSIIFIVVLLISIFIKPAEKIGLVSSNEEKEIENIVEDIIDSNNIELREIKKSNLKIISE